MTEDARRCSRCGIDKPLEEFNRRGGGKRQAYCRACNAAYLREHYRRNLAYYKAKAAKNRRVAQRNGMRYVWEYLADHPCVDCGETDPVVLQFDHVRGVKRSAVSRLLGPGFSVARIAAEIAKCEVRCANCHFRRTAQQRGWYAYMTTDRGSSNGRTAAFGAENRGSTPRPRAP